MSWTSFTRGYLQILCQNYWRIFSQEKCMHLINKVTLNLGIEEYCETDCTSEAESQQVSSLKSAAKELNLGTIKKQLTE